MSTNSIHTVTVPALTTAEKIFQVVSAAIAIAIFIIGALALALDGLQVGNLGYLSANGGLGLFLSAPPMMIIQLCYLSTKNTKHYSIEDLGDEPVEVTTREICCANRFTHGHQDDRNPLWDTWENITLMHMGGFREYPPLPKQMAELWGPSPVTPMEDKLRIRWMRHASFLIQIKVHDKVTTILTDPNWSKTIRFLGPIPLYYASLEPGLPFDEVQKVDLIVDSHTHADHCDPATNQQFYDRDRSEFCCPMGAAGLFPKGASVTQMSWWQEITLEDGTKITYLPCNHASQTTALDCNEYLWGGYMFSVPLENEQWYHLYFMADTTCNINRSIQGFQPEFWKFDTQVFNSIHEKFPVIDCLLYPTDPEWGQEDKHSNVYQAIDLMSRILKPKMFIPMHWGTWPFNTHGRDLLAPVRILKEAVKEQDPELFKRLVQLKVGEELTLVRGK